MRRPIIALMRALAYIAAISPLIALATSTLTTSPSVTQNLASPRWGMVYELGTPPRWQEPFNVFLVDHQSGETKALALPEGEHWGMLSAAPWCDPEGNSEAVGQYFRHSAAGGGDAFWGLGRLQLPQGKLIDRVDLDLLPTSRPCWVPGRPSTILFAAGDGQLHRLEFSDPGAAGEGPAVRDVPEARAVAWKSPRPCKGALFLSDPAWPGHPAFPQIVFAALVAAPLPSDPGKSPVNRLWWLKMNEDGTAIEASGPLIEAGSGGDSVPVGRRFPDLAVGPDGSLHLVYLSRRQTRGERLESLPIEADPASGHPRVAAGARPRVITSDWSMGPPVCSADRRSVYGISQATGRLVKHAILAHTVLATR